MTLNFMLTYTCIILFDFTELEVFIGQTSIKLNSFMDSTFVFSALPTAVLKWIDVVVEVYNKLNIRTSKLESTFSHYAGCNGIYIYITYSRHAYIYSL